MLSFPVWVSGMVLYEKYTQGVCVCKCVHIVQQTFVVEKCAACARKGSTLAFIMDPGATQQVLCKQP